MDLPNVPYVLLPKVGQWIRLADWEYSPVKIYEVDWKKKLFRAHFLMPRKYEDMPSLNYSDVNEEDWISFERIETTIRKFWDLPTIEGLEEALSKQQLALKS